MAILPENEITIAGIERVSYPTTSYLVNTDSKYCFYSKDDFELMGQAIEILLQVERYQYPIFDSNIGIQTLDLVGQDLAYIINVLEQRIRSVLATDDRILGISNYRYEKDGKELSVYFTVNTIYGDYDKDMKVAI